MLVVRGAGLHTGRPVEVTLALEAGPTSLAGVPVRAWSPVRAERATQVQARGRTVSTVEHLFAALAGLGLHEGIAIGVDGDELPLLDGCATRWCEALASLAPRAGPPSLRVVRAGVVDVGASRYAFEPGDEVLVRVSLAFEDARVAEAAAWDGTRAGFVRTIAPARTFAFAREVEELLARGLAKHVEPDSVVVIAPEGLLAAGREATWDEPARHKVLDLVGDLFLHGGPPRGTVRAVRPGHSATHTAIARARSDGLLALG